MLVFIEGKSLKVIDDCREIKIQIKTGKLFTFVNSLFEFNQTCVRGSYFKCEKT